LATGDQIVNISSSGSSALAQADLSGFVSEHFPPGRWLNVRRVDTSALTAMMADVDGDFPIAGDWYSDEVHYFDMSLSARPAGARGCFADSFSDYQRVGKVFFAPAGYRYHGEGGQGRQQRIIIFLRARAPSDDELEFGGNLAPVLRHCMHLQSNVLRELLSRIGREICQPGFASELLLEGLGITLLAETARLLRTLRTDSVRKGGLSAWRMKIIEDRVRCGGPHPTLSELAGLCGLSRRHLVRTFREETGQTIGSFVQHLIMERAKALLSETEQPIKVVAANLGFANPAAFATAFRRASGQRPRDFRAARRAGV
jgi:AraC family transcriptional regulator